ncbi:MAG: hypothetical protein RL141_334 [Candidatus Parcubacteria bacterium]|jgi:phosphoglycerate kinase
MALRSLPSTLDLGCARVYVRVDWNIPFQGGMDVESALKLSRSYPLLHRLREQGAITFILTHLGRPTGREKRYSTKPLAAIVAAHSGLPITFLDADLGTATGRDRFALDVDRAQPGSLVLLENVRFQPGEEKNAASLVKTYASHADVFINDAFASCHRAHASVVGLAKAMPSYAGPALQAEVKALTPLLGKPQRPYVAIVGGAKLTTKLPVLRALLKKADTVLVGGAMAHPFFAARKQPIGKSLVDAEGTREAKKLLRVKQLLVPEDVVVARRVAIGETPRAIALNAIKKTDIIVDIGPKTMEAWSTLIRAAKTVVWNGPVGVAEIPAFSHGSLLIGRAIASRAKGDAYGVAGGGDTIPVVARTGMQEWFDFVSTGGGAMLEFLAGNGKLPGLAALEGVGNRRMPARPPSTPEQGMSCAPDLPVSPSVLKRFKKRRA